MSEHRIVCQQCRKQGEKSVVRFGVAFKTGMCVLEFYDEEGLFHSHDPNISSRTFTCSVVTYGSNQYPWFVNADGRPRAR